MLDLSQSNQYIRTLLAALLNIDPKSVRPANQNAPTGMLGDQFVTVLLNECAPEGVDETHQADSGDDIIQTTVGQRHLVASVQIFRGDALSKCSRLGSLLRSSAATDLLQQQGLGLIRVGPMTNVSAVVDTLWEERGQLEVELYCISEEQATIHTYGEATVTVKTETTTQSSEVILQ